MNLLKYPRKLTKLTNAVYSLSFVGSIACFIKYPEKEWWLPLFVVASYVFTAWLVKTRIKIDKRDAKNKEWSKALARDCFNNLQFVQPNYWPLLCNRHPEQTKTPCPLCYPYTVEELILIEDKRRDEINLQYLAEDYKSQNISFNCTCQTREQFELFSKFLLEFQRIGGKVI